MATTNLFDLLDQDLPTIDVPASEPATTLRVSANLEATSARDSHQQRNGAIAEPKSITKPLTGHNLSKLVYSREWLLDMCKDYPMPSNFNNTTGAESLIRLMPRALLPDPPEIEETDDQRQNHRYNQRGRGRGRGRGQARDGHHQGQGERYYNNPRSQQQHDGNSNDRRHGHHSRHEDSSQPSQHHHHHHSNTATTNAPAGNDWMNEGNDISLEGTLEAVAGRLGVSLLAEESPTGIPNLNSSASSTASQNASKQATQDNWRRKDEPKSASHPQHNRPQTSNARFAGEKESDQRHSNTAALAGDSASAAKPAHNPHREWNWNGNSHTQQQQQQTAAASAQQQQQQVINSVWWYIDSNKEIQGPFTGAKMTSWLNYFNPDLPIGASEQGPWILLGERCHGHINPFDGSSLKNSNCLEFMKKLQEWSKTTPVTLPQQQAHHHQQQQTHHQQQQQHHQQQQPQQASKGGSVKLDDLFGSIPAQHANAPNQQTQQQHQQQMHYHQQQQQRMQQQGYQYQQHPQPGNQAFAGEAGGQVPWASQQTHHHHHNQPISFKQIQEQEAAGHRSQQHISSNVGSGHKPAETQSLFALNFGDSQVHSKSLPSQPSHDSTDAKQNNPTVADLFDSAMPATQQHANVPITHQASSHPSHPIHNLAPAPSILAATAVPPPAVAPTKVPSLYEIQQEEMRRSAEEKAAESQRLKEMQAAAAASKKEQKSTWADSVGSKPQSSSSAAKGTSLRHILEEQAKESAEAKVKSEETNRQVQQAAPPKPNFAGAWGGSSSSKPTLSLKEIQRQEEAAQQASKTPSNAQVLPATSVGSSWASAASKTSKPSAVTEASNPHATNSNNDEEGFWDYNPPAEDASQAPKAKQAGQQQYPKNAGKKKGQRVVIPL